MTFASFKSLRCVVILAALSLSSRAIIINNPYYMESFNPMSIQGDGTSHATGNCWTASSNTNGSPVTLMPCVLGSASQSWTFLPISSVPNPSNKTVTISIFGGTKCLDVKDGLDANGTKLQIWTCGNGNNNQMWVEGIEGDESPGLHIQWAGGKGTRCVDLSGGNQGSGTPLQICTCQPQTNTNQKWVPEWASPFPVGSGSPMLFHSALQVETSHQLSISVILYITPTPTITMQFTDMPSVLPVIWVYNNGTVRMEFDPTFCWDVVDGVNADGTKIQFNTCIMGSKNQLWDFDADYSIRWRGTDKCLDLTDGNLEPGNQLQIWTCSSGIKHQKWRIEAIE